MKAADIAAVEVVEELDVAGDGSVAVLVKRVIRRGRGRLVYESHLWVVDLAPPHRARRLTHGPVRDTWPRLSPDTTLVAFLRSDPLDDEAPNRLCVIPTAGGAVRTLAPRNSRPGFGAIGEAMGGRR